MRLTKSRRRNVSNPRAVSGHFQIGRQITQKSFFNALYAILERLNTIRYVSITYEIKNERDYESEKITIKICRQ